MTDNMDEGAAKLKTIANDLLVPDISYDESQKQYQKWANDGTYDELIYEENYTAPATCVTAMGKLFSEPRSALVVLDIGAGTGILGELLRNNGFMKLHALEPCKEFVAMAEKKCIYETILSEFIGNGSIISSNDDTYDAVVATGVFGPGHIPHDALNEIIRILKPGGYFVNCMRQEYLHTVKDYKDNLVPLMNRLEQEGKWREVMWETYANHFIGHDGQLMAFQKC